MSLNNGHQHDACPICQGRVDTHARVSPVALWVAIVVAALVALLVMPYSWVLHVARASATLGLIALVCGFVTALVIVLIRAAGVSNQHH